LVVCCCCSSFWLQKVAPGNDLEPSLKLSAHIGAENWTKFLQVIISLFLMLEKKTLDSGTARYQNQPCTWGVLQYTVFKFRCQIFGTSWSQLQLHKIKTLSKLELIVASIWVCNIHLLNIPKFTTSTFAYVMM
jgi:hypothetical protein